MEASRCPGYLDVLLGMEIVVKETPAVEKEGRKTIYRLADHMFRFWYLYVFPNMSAIISGRGEQLYDEKTPFFIGDVGFWWGE